ncbi:hypothetical protein GVAV_002637 [Gurleya vavrai]
MHSFKKRFAATFFIFLHNNIFAIDHNTNTKKQKEYNKNNLNGNSIMMDYNMPKEIVEEDFLALENKQNIYYINILRRQEPKRIVAAEFFITEKDWQNEDFLISIMNPIYESNVEIYKVFYNPTNIISKMDSNIPSNGGINEDLEQILADIKLSKKELLIKIQKFTNIKTSLDLIIEKIISNLNKNEDFVKETTQKINSKSQEKSALINFNYANPSNPEYENNEKLTNKLSNEIRILEDEKFYAKKTISNNKEQFNIVAEYVKEYLKISKLFNIKKTIGGEKLYDIKKVMDKYRNENDILKHKICDIFIKDLEKSNAGLLKKTNYFYDLIKECQKNKYEKQQILKIKIDCKTVQSRRFHPKKNYNITDEKDKIELFFYNSDEHYILNIEEMHKIIDELKTNFGIIKILKAKIQILKDQITINLNHLRQLDSKQNHNQNEQLLNNSEAGLSNTKNKFLSKDIFYEINEIEKNLEVVNDEFIIYKRFFELQYKLEEISDTKRKIFYLHDFYKNLNKNDENLFFEMCHSELIFLVNNQLLNEEKSRENNKTNKILELNIPINSTLSGTTNGLPIIDQYKDSNGKKNEHKQKTPIYEPEKTKHTLLKNSEINDTRSTKTKPIIYEEPFRKTKSIITSDGANNNFSFIPKSKINTSETDVNNTNNKPKNILDHPKLTDITSIDGKPIIPIPKITSDIPKTNNPLNNTIQEETPDEINLPITLSDVNNSSTSIPINSNVPETKNIIKNDQKEIQTRVDITSTTFVDEDSITSIPEKSKNLVKNDPDNIKKNNEIVLDESVEKSTSPVANNSIDPKSDIIINTLEANKQNNGTLETISTENVKDHNELKDNNPEGNLILDRMHNTKAHAENKVESNVISQKLQDKGNKPFYTKIWFITSVSIITASTVGILIYVLKK